MTDFEERLRRGMASYAGAMPVEKGRPPRPVAGAMRAGRTRKRKAAWATGSVLAAVVIGGTAAATGTAPAPVLEVFDEWSESLGLGDVQHAERVASARTEDGGRIELWIGEGDGGDCLHQVTVSPDGAYGQAHSGWQSCGPDVLSARSETQVRLLAHPDPIAGLSVEGRAPTGTTHVSLELSDGTRLQSPVGEGGWFVVAFKSDLPASTRLLRVTANSADGDGIASEDLAPLAPLRDPSGR